MTKFHVYRTGNLWAWDLRDAAGRVLHTSPRHHTIDAAIADIDYIKRAPVIVAPLPRQPTTRNQGPM